MGVPDRSVSAPAEKKRPTSPRALEKTASTVIRADPPLADPSSSCLIALRPAQEPVTNSAAAYHQDSGAHAPGSTTPTTLENTRAPSHHTTPAHDALDLTTRHDASDTNDLVTATENNAALDIPGTPLIAPLEPDHLDFIGDKILQNPPHNPWDHTELCFYHKSRWGTYAGNWEGATKFPNPLKVLKSSLQNPYPKKEELDKLSVVLDFEALRNPPCGPSGVQATWFGHASYLVQVGGFNILTDPVFSSRCFPIQCVGPRRIVASPCEIEELPRIDIVTVSHNHYDHLDHNSIQRLRKAFQPIFLVPKGMRSWFKGLKWKRTPEEKAAGIKNPVKATVFELEWWAPKWVAPPSNPNARVLVTLVPAQHWSMRTGPWDKDRQLWGGFVYEVDVARHMPNDPFADPGVPAYSGPCVRRIYHSGDTGYNTRIFNEIGNVFRRFDLAMLPIGAYHPRWYLKDQHVDPAQAVRIHIDLNRPTQSIAMHWGTWILSDEAILEPPILLAEAAAAAGLKEDEFMAPKHGMSVRLTAEPCLHHIGIEDRHMSLASPVPGYPTPTARRDDDEEEQREEDRAAPQLQQE